jgi:SAM-dependent methyltransferase
VNDLEPPLRFAEEDSFDLVTAASVFTHIPLDLQRRWLEEIRRILRPGGYFLCTVAGAHHIGIQLSPELKGRLRKEGHVTLGSDDPGVSYATKAAGSWDVFQTREEVLRSFGSVFEVLHYQLVGEGPGQPRAAEAVGPPHAYDGLRERCAESCQLARNVDFPDPRHARS